MSCTILVQFLVRLIFEFLDNFCRRFFVLESKFATLKHFGNLWLDLYYHTIFSHFLMNFPSFGRLLCTILVQFLVTLEFLSFYIFICSFYRRSLILESKFDALEHFRSLDTLKYWNIKKLFTLGSRRFFIFLFKNKHVQIVHVEFNEKRVFCNISRITRVIGNCLAQFESVKGS